LRMGAGTGDVVGVHVDGVPADHIAGERDRVALGDEQEGAAGVDYRSVTADARADKDARVARLDPFEERGEEIVWKLPNIHAWYAV
jgi:hypothetical protein